MDVPVHATPCGLSLSCSRCCSLSELLYESTSELAQHSMPRKPQIAVIGGSNPSAEVEGWAEEVGSLIAQHDAVVVCGGLGGVMAAAARGAARSNGLSVGILPTYDVHTAAPGISITVPTGLGHARNMLVIASGDAVIALPGSSGTLSEIAFALTLKKTVAAIRAWSHIEGVRVVQTPQDAVQLALRAASRSA